MVTGGFFHPTHFFLPSGEHHNGVELLRFVSSVNPPYYKNWWYSVSVLGGRCEWNPKILAMYYWWELKTINCFLHYQEGFTLIKCSTWITGLGSTDSKGNIFLPKSKQNESPQKNFCLSSRTYTYDLTVAWGVSTVGRLRFECILWAQESCSLERSTEWSAQSLRKRSHCMNKTVNNDFWLKKKNCHSVSLTEK